MPVDRKTPHFLKVDFDKDQIAEIRSGTTSSGDAKESDDVIVTHAVIAFVDMVNADLGNVRASVEKSWYEMPTGGNNIRILITLNERQWNGLHASARMLRIRATEVARSAVYNVWRQATSNS